MTYSRKSESGSEMLVILEIMHVGPFSQRSHAAESSAPRNCCSRRKPTQRAFVSRCDWKVCFRDIQAVEWPVRGPGTNAHRDIRTGRPASYRTVRVTPPNIHSLRWEWP
jgi:hypothetical protein